VMCCAAAVLRGDVLCCGGTAWRCAVLQRYCVMCCVAAVLRGDVLCCSGTA